MQLPSHSTLGLQRSLPNFLLERTPRISLLQQPGKVWHSSSLGCPGQRGAHPGCQSRARATAEAATGASPGALSLSLQLPCPGVSGNGDFRADLGHVEQQPSRAARAPLTPPAAPQGHKALLSTHWVTFLNSTQKDPGKQVCSVTQAAAWLNLADIYLRTSCALNPFNST